MGSWANIAVRDEINKKLVELGKRRDGVWQRQVTELLQLIDRYAVEAYDKAIRDMHEP